MNKLIFELAKQADLIQWDTLPSGARTPDHESVVKAKKFAELLIQECARIARATPAPNFHEHLKQRLGHTWDMAAVEAGREIVKHFGVKE